MVKHVFYGQEPGESASAFMPALAAPKIAPESIKKILDNAERMVMTEQPLAKMSLSQLRKSRGFTQRQVAERMEKPVKPKTRGLKNLYARLKRLQPKAGESDDVRPKLTRADISLILAGLSGLTPMEEQ